MASAKAEEMTEDPAQGETDRVEEPTQQAILITLRHQSQTQPTNGAILTLVALPPDVHLTIFDNLDRASSACLGLTCKTLYPLYKRVRGMAPLCAFYFVPGSPFRVGFRLHVLLREWMGRELMYDCVKDKFVKREGPCDLECCERGNPFHENIKSKRRDKKEKMKDAREAGDKYWALK